MPTTFRAATFNLENLFTRAKVLNLEDKAKASGILNDIAKLNQLLGNATYTAPVKQQILDLSEALSDYIEIREDRGKLFSGQGANRRVSASGAKAWDGVIELRRARVPEMARRSTASAVKALKADVLCTVEVEDRMILKDFDTQMLGADKFKYPMVIDGNDPRGIDVGVLSDFDILKIATHMFDKDAGGTIFSRDCPEYELKLPDGRSLFVLCNHFKSQGFGSPAANNTKRKRQAARVAEILAGYDLAKDMVIVAGDFNDKPDSAPLAPLLSVSNLTDVLALQFSNKADRWTYKYRNDLSQIDYLLVSKPLKTGFQGAQIERRGVHGLPGVTPFPSVTSPSTAASDHCAIVAEFSV
jgi:endonuclease/exonuclease/phosphatase family metal-dependent hydrolase